MIEARNLHKWLGVDSRFHDWLRRRFTEYGFEEGTDYCSSLSVRTDGKGGRRRRDYLLTIDTAKELSMVERTEIGRATRRYFIQMEGAALKMAADHIAHGTQPANAPASM